MEHTITIAMLVTICIISSICFVMAPRKANKNKNQEDIGRSNSGNAETEGHIKTSNAPMIASIVWNGLLVLAGISVLLWGIFSGYDFWGDDFSWDIWPPQTAVDYFSLACILLDIPFFFTVFFFGISLSSKAGAKEGSRYYTAREGVLGGITISNRSNASTGGCLGAIVGFVLAIVIFVSFAQLALLVFTIIRAIKLIVSIVKLKSNILPSSAKTQRKEAEMNPFDLILNESFESNTKKIEIKDSKNDEWTFERLDVFFYQDNAYGVLLPVKVPKQYEEIVPTDGSQPVLIKMTSHDGRMRIINNENDEFEELNNRYKQLYCEETK